MPLRLLFVCASLVVLGCDADPSPPLSGAGDSPVTLALTRATGGRLVTGKAGVPLPATPTLGDVTPEGDCDLSTLFVGATCERYIVQCEGLSAATVNLVIAEPPPTVPVQATVLLGSGSAGASLIEKATIDPTGESALVAELTRLRKKGFRIVQRAWQGDAPGDRGWLRGVEGPDDSACRYATLATWLADRYDAEGAFCALGFSGGSVELALAMARWGLADRLDQAIFVSGPVARFDQACIGGPASDAACDEALEAHPWECTTPPLACELGDDITLLIDTAYGGDPLCSSRDPVYAEQLHQDSVLGPGSTSDFPETELAVVLGMRDCGSGAATGGAELATLFTGRGGEPALVIEVPGAGHSLHARPEGARALRELIQSGCRPPTP